MASTTDVELLRLQRCFASLALEPGAGGFERDPGAFAARHGLDERNQEAFRCWQDRLLYYREAVREALWEPMERYFPLVQTLLEEAHSWEACRAAFLATRAITSPFYRDVAPTFLGWLATSGWGQDRWPHLLQLAHFELVKELVEHLPEGPYPGNLHRVPGPGDHLVPATPTQVLSYTYLVHEATFDHPEPLPGSCHLLAYRAEDGYVRWRVLTEAAAALLMLAQSTPIASTLEALGLGGREGYGDDGDAGALTGTLAFLVELRDAGALKGFATP